MIEYNYSQRKRKVKRKERKVKDLTKGNIYKTFFLFGFPLVISGLLSISFNTIDKVIVGKFLGTRALAALGATSPLITFVSSIIWGYEVGVAIYTAKLFGAGDYKRLKSVYYSNLLFVFFLATAIGLSLLVFRDPIFDFLKIEKSLRKTAFEYFSVYMGGLFFLNATVIGSHVLTSLGISGYPMCISIISAVINLVGNIVSAIVFDWGLLGIAGFSVFAALVSNIAYYMKLGNCFQKLGVGRVKAELSFRHIKDTCSYAIPNTLQQGILYFSSLMVSPIVNRLGVAASASYSVVSSVQDISMQVYQNSTRCVVNYTAQCVGEEKYENINRGVFVGLLQSTAFALPFILSTMLFAEPICGLFLKSDADALTKEYSYLFARRYFPFMFFNLICNVFHALFKGVKAPAHLIGGTLIGTSSRIGLSYLLLGKGIKGFYTAWVLAWVIETVFSVVFYFVGLWKPQRKENRKQKQEITA